MVVHVDFNKEIIGDFQAIIYQYVIFLKADVTSLLTRTSFLFYYSTRLGSKLLCVFIQNHIIPMFLANHKNSTYVLSKIEYDILLEHAGFSYLTKQLIYECTVPKILKVICLLCRTLIQLCDKCISRLGHHV